MIESIKVSNYRSLGPDTFISLGTLTVFVGQNGAGKSNIIDLFRFVSDAMKIGLEGAITKRGGIKSIRRWSNGRPFNISIEFTIADSDGFKATYGFEIGGHKTHEYSVTNEHAYIYDPNIGHYQYVIVNQKWQTVPQGISPSLTPMNLALPLISGDSRFSRLEDALRNVCIYNIFPDTLRAAQRYDPQRPMNEHGSNWMSILKDQEKSQWKDDLILALNKITGDIDNIEVEQLSGFLITRFKHGTAGDSQKSKWFEASQESDGTLRTAGIITALLQEPSLPLVGIEEPELTIHPGAIPVIYDYLVQSSYHSQVIVTTHSPELLDEIRDVSQIRVVKKGNDFSLVNEIADDQKEAIKAGLYTLGEIHRGEGLKIKQLEMFESNSNS